MYFYKISKEYNELENINYRNNSIFGIFLKKSSHKPSIFLFMLINECSQCLQFLINIRCGET